MEKAILFERVPGRAGAKDAPPPCGRESARCAIERDDDSSNRHPALGYCWSMIFSENQFPLFGIML
jgi:hypothetical protein